MKALVMTATAVLILASISPERASATATNGLQRVYLNDQGQVIGESFRYCGNNSTSHWGNASKNATSWVQALYSCEGSGVSVGYFNIPAPIQETFCITYWEVCTQTQPFPQYDYVVGPITSGLYSD